MGQLTDLEISINYCAEMDEFWSFVEKKENQRWTWYAMEKQTGLIISWHNGKGTDEDLKILLGQIEHIPIAKYDTDDWGAYARLLIPDKHIVGKDESWKN